MWDKLKSAPLAWKLLAYVGIPIIAILAGATISLLGFLIKDRSINQPQPTKQEVVADVPTPLVSPTPEATATPTPPEISYELNWKIEEGQPIAYNTAMEVSISNTSVDFDRIFNSSQSGEGNEAASHFQEMFENLQNSQPTYSIVSILEKNARGNISIKMVLDNVEIPEQKSDDLRGQEFSQLLKGMEGRIQLQGEVTPEGEIASPHLAQQQKNLLALFFELPGRPVKVGDTWQIDLTCITVNSAQFTIENSDGTNQVTFTEITETPEGELVAILDYLVAESVEGEQTIPFFSEKPVPASMKCSFIGRGQFLIEQGRWQQFSAEFTIQTTGVMTADVTQHLALSPLGQVPEYSD